MYVYVKFDDGAFATVEDTQINHFTQPYDRLKKYKVTIGDCTQDAIIVHIAGNLNFIKYL